MIPNPTDPLIVSWAALITAALALGTIIAKILLEMLRKPRPKDWREVEDLNAALRRSDLPDTTVPLVRSSTVYSTRNGRRG